MKLDYRVKREGRVWLAFLRRPGNPRPLFCAGASKHEAIAGLLTIAAKSPPDRMFGKDWTEAANAQAAANQITNAQAQGH